MNIYYDHNDIEGYIKRNSLVKGDCLEVMSKIEDKSVDMILADLPYGTTKAKWDSLIDLDELWKHYKRIIKDRGIILLFAQTPFDKVLGCSNLKWLKYEWIWEKTQATGFYNCNIAPLKAHENILVFYKKTPKYFPQKTTGHNPINSYTKKADVQNKTEIYGKVTKDISGGGETDRFPRSVQVFASDKQKNKLDGTLHSTQKPLALCEYLIKTYTQEGDLVLDNVCGSGTTGLAAKNLNRDFILIEKEDEFIEISKKRIL